MINSKKKGFTIIELVIVIAVIAVLAAVLIPTFSSLVKKANMSADQQAVTQMNKLLKVEEIDKGPLAIGDVYEVLNKNGYKDYTPYYEGYTLYWIGEENVIVLVENEEVVFPEKYKGSTQNKTPLRGDVLLAESHFNKPEDGSGTKENPYKVNDSADIIAIKKMVESGNNLDNTVFEITESVTLNDWEPMGVIEYGENGHITGEVVPFSGEFNGNGNTITLNVTNKEDAALFAVVAGATIKNVVLNVTIDTNSVVGGLVSMVDLRYGVSTTIEDVTVKGTIVTSSNIAGGIIGNTNATYELSKDYDGEPGTLYLKNLTNEASIKSTLTSGSYDVKLGGIVGQISQMNLVMENCVNTGEITAETKYEIGEYSTYAGGLVGMCQGGPGRVFTIKNSKNTGALDANVEADIIAIALNGGYYSVQGEGYTDLASVRNAFGQLNRASSYAGYEFVVGNEAYVVRAGGRIDDDSNKAKNKVLFSKLVVNDDLSSQIDKNIKFIEFAKGKNANFAGYPVNNLDTFLRAFHPTQTIKEPHKQANATKTSLFGEGWNSLLSDYNTANPTAQLSETDFACSTWTSNVLYKVSYENSGK